jgi:hypothetical protein
MSESKKPKIIFGPEFAADFEGTAEELQALVDEISSMFEGLTIEEIKAMSRPVDIDELMEENPEEARKLLAAIENHNNPPTLH